MIETYIDIIEITLKFLKLRWNYWNYIDIIEITWKLLKLHRHYRNYIEIIDITLKLLKLHWNYWNYSEIIDILDETVYILGEQFNSFEKHPKYFDFFWFVQKVFPRIPGGCRHQESAGNRGLDKFYRRFWDICCWKNTMFCLAKWIVPHRPKIVSKTKNRDTHIN